MNIEETCSTLEFAKRANKIRTNAKINERIEALSRSVLEEKHNDGFKLEEEKQEDSSKQLVEIIQFLQMELIRKELEIQELKKKLNK